MYKVVIAPGAKEELRQSIDYIRRELSNPPAAAHLADMAHDVLLALRSMPTRFSECDDPTLRIHGYRKAPVGSYLFVFRITERPRIVRILHFFHETQDYLSLLRVDV